MLGLLVELHDFNVVTAMVIQLTVLQQNTQTEMASQDWTSGHPWTR